MYLGSSAPRFLNAAPTNVAQVFRPEALDVDFDVRRPRPGIRNQKNLTSEEVSYMNAPVLALAAM